MDNEESSTPIEDMFPPFIKPPKAASKYKLDKLQFHRKFGQVAIYRIIESKENDPSYLVLNWIQANHFKLKTQ
jgi:hypothetical protein